jgi:hypothetical protein
MSRIHRNDDTVRTRHTWLCIYYCNARSGNATDGSAISSIVWYCSVKGGRSMQRCKIGIPVTHQLVLIQAEACTLSQQAQLWGH